MTNKELLSKSISWLRFPLIVGVVFIHNNISTVKLQGVEYEFNNPDWYYFIIDFFSEVLPRISVPLFFFISGFLFFYNVSFNGETYKRKLRSRVRTLLMPYLIWNLIGFMEFSIKRLPAFASLFPTTAKYPYNITTFLDSFWAISMDPDKAPTMPINYPFWFIRDLMIVVLITPLIYWLIKRVKAVPVVIFGLCWYSGYWFDIPGLSIAAMFFFVLGAYFSINDINVVTLFNRFKAVPVLYLVIAIIDTVTKGALFNGYIHKAGILLGVMSCFIITSAYLEKGKFRINKFLSDASFFVFALHALIIGLIMKGLFLLISPESPFLLIFLYFFVPIVTIVICLLVYKVLKNWFPSLASILTGGR